MPIIVDGTKARQRRTVIDIEDYTRTTREEDRYFATQYMGAPTDTVSGAMPGVDADKSLPQAYLVEQPAHATVPPHFHDTNQFQVFVAGTTGFGKAVMKPLSVHYAGGHTPYGPIVTRDEGVHFFTLRQEWDSGGKPMPECRDRLKRVRRRFRTADDILAMAQPGRRSDVLPCEDDGLGVSLFSLTAGQQQCLDLPAAGGGQYALVIDGDVSHRGSTYAKHSCFFRYAEEAPLAVTAGDDGASILLLQFPTSQNDAAVV